MKKDNREKSQKDYLVLVLILYSVSGILLLKYYRYQINNDGVNYISIAQKYLAGNFQDAINGLWGPLFSWLLMPFLFLRVEPLLATKILNLIIGLLIIIVMSSLVHQFSLSVWTRRVILFSHIPIIFSFVVRVISPDLLLTCLLLVYFRVIFQPNYGATMKHGAVCGLWGGIAYLAKAYAFPFFISHFLLMNILHYFKRDSREEKHKILVNCFYGFLVFGVISGVWIAAISAKYDQLTFSNVPRMAKMKRSPILRPSDKHTQRFVSPPNPTAVSISEDFSFYYSSLNVSPQSPFNSLDALKHRFETTMVNVSKIVRVFLLFSILSFPICIAYFLFLLQDPHRILRQCVILYPFMSLLLFCAGYSLVHVTERYLWIIDFLLLLMGGYVVDKLLQDNFFTKIRRTALYIIFMASFVSVPILIRLPGYFNNGLSTYLLSQRLRNHIRPGDRIASNTEWNRTMALAYHRGARYYGQARQNISEQELEEKLRKFNINHYLVWGEPVKNELFLSGYEQEDIDGTIELKLYRSVTTE